MLPELITFLKTFTPYLLGGVFVCIYIGEHIYPQQKELTYFRHDALNMLTGLVNMAFVFTGGVYFQQFITFVNARHFGVLQLFGLPALPGLVAGFLLIDCFLYWWHRFNHTIPFFWWFHRYHHKDKKMNSTTAVRFHTGELVLSYLIKLMVFPLLGISVGAVLLHSLVLFPVIVFHHSNLKINGKKDWLLRHLIVTPRMHRVHHSNVKFDTDSNYSSVLPLWDRLFSTYHKPGNGPVQFGI